MTLPDSVSDNNVQLTERTPSRLTVDVERAVEKQVDVEVDISNEVADGYVADLEAMKISPETITVFGPEAEVSKIDSARVSLDIGGVTETVDNSFPYQLGRFRRQRRRHDELPLQRRRGRCHAVGRKV